ncbi:hypothetical protein AAFF_G00037050 [Aldrovandia affinis]|uniref:Tyrosine-protein kinase BAZ1B n=1 Tax=Aldrovandia affinis TaxID=143900 RepID=A0AAD7T542_9TELE|nr:hypothetical protein AAFF_G00037050 [Aldrovandia affinis]
MRPQRRSWTGPATPPPATRRTLRRRTRRRSPALPEEGSRRDSLCDRARRSPRKLPVSLKEEKKKWVMPKFLPHKYDIRLISEDKVISNVPADSLFRTERPPNKEIMRYFIRHNALRLGTGESAPWVVEDELVKKYSLPSKLSDFLLDPYKYMADNPSAKRKSLSSPDGKPAKKLKTGEAGEEGDSANKKGEKEKKKQKKSSVGMPLSPSMWGHVQTKKVNGSPLKMKNADGEGDDVLGTPGFQKGSKAKKSGTKSINGQKTPKKEEKGGKKPKMKQMTLLGMAKGGSPTSSKKRPRSSGPGTPKLGKPLPPMALHLLRYYKENKGKEDKKNGLSCMVSKVAKVLTAEDRGRLPEELRDMVQKRWELLESKRRWAAMSEEEKKEVMRRKREEIKEKLREKAKERREKEMQARRELQRRFEDQELEGRSLPVFKLVDTPEGLPNALFGDVAMVTDFLNCYAGLLMPDDQYPVAAVALMDALASERAGFLYLNRVLVILLQTLLQDELAEGYSELDMALSEIPLTLHSVSELVRLCLRPCDAHGEESGQGGGSEDWPPGTGYDDVVSPEFLERLETAEVFELNPPEKVSLLVALCHRILMTYSVEDHVDCMQQRTAELWKERLATLKEVNDRKRAEKQRRKEQMEAKGAAGTCVKVEGGAGAGTGSGAVAVAGTGTGTGAGAGAVAGAGAGAGGVVELTPVSSGKKKEVGKAKAEPLPATPEPEAEDMISTVKSRRLMAIQAKKEKEEHERQNKERMEKEAEEERSRKQKASAERAFLEGITKAKLVLRRVPLGTDRNHNRYWLFSDVVPGLYIEKGWVHESVNYSFTLPPEEEGDEEEMEEEEVEKVEEEEEEECSPEGALAEGGHQGVLPGPDTIETTIPKLGQNLWCVCDTTRELEELLESLHPQGVRESELKSRLQYKYQDILHSIYLARKPNLGLKTCDGHQELLRYLRSDVMEVASRLHKGGLGYMDDLSEFEERVRSLEKLKDFGECVIALQASVIKKFRQGFMAPKQKKKRKPGGEESGKMEEVDDEKKLAEEARVATAVEKWKSAIREAQTFSRMHVLLGMLDACIKWDMSAENSRCKVCRKKGEDDKLILCDECNKAFHLFCLRPVLYSIPEREWLCPACQPAVARRCSRGRNYNEDTEEEEDSEEEDEEDSEEDSDEEWEEEENDYRAIGHSLRPRKGAKVKYSSSRAKAGGKTAPKKQKQPQPASKVGRPRSAPSNPVDIDELVRQSSGSGPGRRVVVELAKCEEILQKLLKFRPSWPFREPVSPEEAEDYLDVISNPMDFQTMLAKFSGGQYRQAGDFVEDMKLLFSNAEEYNQPGSTVLTCLAKTEQSFTDLLRKLLPGLPYLRRHQRKRVNQNHQRDHSEEDEEREEQPERKTRNGRPGRPPKREEGVRGGKTRQRKRNGSTSTRRHEAEEEEEEEVEEEESDEGADTVKRKSKRAAVRAGRKDYREQESDSEQEEEQEEEQEGAGKRKRWARGRPEEEEEEEEVEEEDSGLVPDGKLDPAAAAPGFPGFFCSSSVRSGRMRRVRS